MIKRDDIQSITTGSPDRLPKATGIPIRGNIKPAPAAAESTVSSIIPSEEDETKHSCEELLIGGDQPEPTGISAREKNRTKPMPQTTEKKKLRKRKSKPLQKLRNSMEKSVIWETK
ncbi:MAG: hypothetical protein LWY06_08695 [Firmicutes bacterium]|nr:hypothetical protein [Bacillota bacterium]